VVADGSTIKAAVHDAAAGGALAVASGSGGPKAAVPSKPRFRHSSITWQLHSAAMARRDDAAAQLAAALSAKPIQEGQETGAAETADDDESGGLQVWLHHQYRMLVNSLETVLSRSNNQITRALHSFLLAVVICSNSPYLLLKNQIFKNGLEKPASLKLHIQYSNK